METDALPTSLAGWCGWTCVGWCGCSCVGVPEGVWARGMSDGDAVLMGSLGTGRRPGVRRVAAMAHRQTMHNSLQVQWETMQVEAGEEVTRACSVVVMELEAWWKGQIHAFFANKATHPPEIV